MQQHDYVLQLTAENSSVPFYLHVGPAQESVGTYMYVSRQKDEDGSTERVVLITGR
jgi:hypothetical protein